MPIATRDIQATWYLPNGELATDEPIVYHLVPGSYAANGMVPTGAVEDTTNDVGQTSTALWVNSDGLTPTKWIVTNPKGEQHRFVVPPGDDPITLEDLLNQEENYPWREDISSDQADLIEESILAKLADTIDPVLGDEMVGSRFEPGGSGRTVNDRLADVISIFDMIPTSEHAAIRDGTTLYDCMADIQRAVDTAATEGRALVFPPGVYPIRSTIIGENDPQNHSLLFENLHDFRMLFEQGAEIQIHDGATTRPIIFRDCANFTLDGLEVKEKRLNQKNGNGICLENCRDYTLLRCNVEDFAGYGYVSSEATNTFSRQSSTIGFIGGATQRITGSGTELQGPLVGERLYLGNTQLNNGFATVKALGNTAGNYYIDVATPADTALWLPGNIELRDESAGPTADTVTSSYLRFADYVMDVHEDDQTTTLFILDDNDYFTVSGSAVGNVGPFKVGENGVTTDGRSVTMTTAAADENPHGAYPITVTRLSYPLVQVWDAKTHGDVIFDSCRAYNCGHFGFEVFPKVLSGTLQLLHLTAIKCGLLNGPGAGIKGGTNFSKVRIVSPTLTKCNYGLNVGNFRANTLTDPHITNGYGVAIAITCSSHYKAPLSTYGSLVIRGGYIGFTNDPDRADGGMFIPEKLTENGIAFTINKPAITMNGLIDDVGLLEITGLTVFKWGAGATGMGLGGIQFSKSTVPTTNIKIHHNKLIDSGGFLTTVLEDFTATLTDGSPNLTNVYNISKPTIPTNGWIAGMQVIAPGIPVDARVVQVIKGPIPTLVLSLPVSVVGTIPNVRLHTGIPYRMAVTDNEFVMTQPSGMQLQFRSDSGDCSRNTLYGGGGYPLRLVCRDGEHVWARNNTIITPNQAGVGGDGAAAIYLGGTGAATNPPLPYDATPIDTLGNYHVYDSTVDLLPDGHLDSFAYSTNCATWVGGNNKYPETLKQINPGGKQPLYEPATHGATRTLYLTYAQFAGGAGVTAPTIGDRVVNVAPSPALAISEWRYSLGSIWIAYGHGRGTSVQRPTLTVADAEYGYYDSTILREIRWSGIAWIVPGEVRRMFAATSAKTVENTTTETSIVPTGVGSLAVATNYLIPGSSIRITALGTFKTAATPTLTLRLSLGPNELITTGAISLPTIPLHSGWRLTATITTRSATQFVVSLTFEFQTAAGVTNQQAINVPVTITTVDTTLAGTIGIRATWSAASTSNSLITYMLIAEDVP